MNRGTRLRSELDRIRHQPHGRARRIDVFFLRDVFLKNVVLKRAGKPRPIHALLLGDREIHCPQNRCRRIDGHRNGDVAQRDSLEQRLHVGQRRDRHAALSDFAQRRGMIRIDAHQRRQIERHRESGLALFEQIAKTRVGLLGRRETCELAHGPQPSAIHRFVDPAGVRKLPGCALDPEPGASKLCV